jgi:COMPASS (Complex protein associated with Set1p) component shg1
MASTFQSRPLRPQLNGLVKEEDFVRPPIKLSDLPITSTQRSAIDGLMNEFKKKGEFDRIRKSVFAEFNNSVCATLSDFRRY